LMERPPPLDIVITLLTYSEGRQRGLEFVSKC
jgi:hypothetical protein